MVKKVDFRRPPVVEVACGVGFALTQRLTAGHIGQFWHSVEDDFPNIEEVAPLPPPNLQEAVKIEVSEIPPMPRTWLLSEDGSRLMQLQADRFLYNWKREEEEEEEIPYPGFDIIYDEFKNHLDLYMEFLVDAGYEKPSYDYLELQYVNHIGAWNGLDVVGRTGALIDHMHSKDPARFLPMPRAFRWQSQYPMPDENGNLGMTVQTATKQPTGEDIIRLDMTARSGLKDGSESSLDKWFALAHEWIVRGFCDVTTPELHDVWKRKS